MNVIRRCSDFVSRCVRGNEPVADWFCIAFTGSRAGLNLQMFDVLSGSSSIPGVIYVCDSALEFRVLERPNQRLLIIYLSFPGLRVALFETIAKNSDLTFLLIETSEFPDRYEEFCEIAGSSFCKLNAEALFESVTRTFSSSQTGPQERETGKLAEIIRREFSNRCAIELDNSWSLMGSLDQACPYFRFLVTEGFDIEVGSDELSISLLDFMPRRLRNTIGIVESQAR